MDKLWAPWRTKYIKITRQKGCVFCKVSKPGRDEYLIFKTKYSFAVLNIFPYNNGHILIAPLRHIADISSLSKEESLDLMQSLIKAKALLDKVLKAEGYNIGINLGKSAGAGITGHLHLHIVPRWAGDTNFMTTVSDAKVISQSLKELHKQLLNAQSKKH